MYAVYLNLKEIIKSKLFNFCHIFREETHPGSRLDHAYPIKELYGTCDMTHQREARTAITELLTWLT